MELAGKVFVAGHRGMVGAAVVRRLEREPGVRLVFRDRAGLDLLDQAAVRAFFAAERPDLVFLAAARVGGIRANAARPAEFIYENLVIETNVIRAAFEHGCRKLLFLGSSCIYPRLAPQPMREEDLLTGPLEPTNEWYAVAKIAGIKLCQAYRRQYGFDAVSAMPTNLYGPGDNFSAGDSHVIPGLLRRFHEAAAENAPEVAVWGGGTALREFLHVDDLADACAHLMRVHTGEQFLNVGSGEEIRIADLARLIAQVTGYAGRIVFDAARPEGAPRKLLDCSRLEATGWRPSIGLREGLAATYAWFLDALRSGSLRLG